MPGPRPRRPQRLPGVGAHPVTAVGVAIALVLAGVILVGPFPDAAASATATGSPAIARAPSNLLTVSSITPWVQADGVFRVRFEPSAAVPLDARFSYTIRQRLRGSGSTSIRQGLDKALTDGTPDRALQSPKEFPVLLMGLPASGLELQIPLRATPGDDSRTYVPTAGVHPVDLALIGADGGVLWQSTVFLNRLPERPAVGRDGQPAVDATQLVVSVESGPALSPTGELDLGAEERASLASLQSLLVEARDLPLTVCLRPNTLVGFERSRDPADGAFVDVARSAKWALARQSYVRVDAAGLVSTSTDELRRQVEAGDGILDQLRPGSDRSLWLLDDTVDPAAAQQLGSMGVQHLLTSPDRFTAPVTAGPASARTFGIDGAGSMTVSAYDAGLTRQLVDPGVEPALRSHRVLSLMMAEWFDAIDQGPEAFPGVSSAIVLPPGIDTAVLRSLTEPLLGDGPLRLAGPPEPTHHDGGEVRVRLLERPAGNLSGVVQRTTQVARRIDGYRSMTTPQNAQSATWDLINDQAPVLFADDAERAALWNGVDASIDADLAEIVPPPSRTIVLTSRSGTIPLRFRNGLGSAVRLVMRTRSPRLRFPDGDTREIVLVPGENRIDVPVVVQASGSSLLRIELSSPDGQLQLAPTTVTVRSSSISGVGAALSIVSLAFLLAWWLHTHRSKRRRRDEADGPRRGHAGTGTGE